MKHSTLPLFVTLFIVVLCGVPLVHAEPFSTQRHEASYQYELRKQKLEQVGYENKLRLDVSKQLDLKKENRPTALIQVRYLGHVVQKPNGEWADDVRLFLAEAKVGLTGDGEIPFMEFNFSPVQFDMGPTAVQFLAASYLRDHFTHVSEKYEVTAASIEIGGALPFPEKTSSSQAFGAIFARALSIGKIDYESLPTGVSAPKKYIGYFSAGADVGGTVDLGSRLQLRLQAAHFSFDFSNHGLAWNYWSEAAFELVDKHSKDVQVKLYGRFGVRGRDLALTGTVTNDTPNIYKYEYIQAGFAGRY